jgi:hypothetical protein
MKRVLSEVLFVIVFFGIFFQFQSVRLPIVFATISIGVWVVLVQMLLSVSLKNWLNELGGQFHKLPFEERIAQIRTTFENLTDVESSKLRWFYIQACFFHYLLLLLISLGFVAIAAFFLIADISSQNSVRTCLSVSGAIIVAWFGYFIIPNMYPPIVRKNIDETLHLFLRKDWKKRLFRADQEMVGRPTAKTFYDFWLEGADLDKKERAFIEFVERINGNSKDGVLFKMNDFGKLEIKCIVHAKGIRKSLAGFLKYCIEERRVLSNEILRHSYRELLRDVFDLESVKNMDFLEGRKYDSTPVDYVKVYRS